MTVHYAHLSLENMRRAVKYSAVPQSRPMRVT